MGRPPKLTSVQEREICSRLAAGESNRSVAKAFRVGETTIRRIFSAQVPKVRDVAQRLAEAELDLMALPVSAQEPARRLADQLKGVSDNLARAALAGSQTATKLSEIAARKAQALGDDLTDLPAIAALGKTANEHASLGLGLLNANREAVKASADETPSQIQVLLHKAGA